MHKENRLIIFESKKIRKRDEELGSYIGTNCPHVEMLTETGKKEL